MTQQERIKIGELWIGLANMYGKEITKKALSIMLSSVSDLDPDVVIVALEEWPMKSKLGRHPFPVEIREAVAPKAETKDLAITTAARIKDAIGRFGWCNEEQAKSFIGNDSWIFVERWGGWSYLCQNLGVTIPETTFLAQCRDIITADLNLGRLGFDSQRPALDQSNIFKLGKEIKMIKSVDD